ncbi:MAG: FKBP-type peptidyl-prolyl cis-trans isomerase [Candidatus Nanoarchaeia archaeon]
MLAKKDFVELELIGKVLPTEQIFMEEKSTICLGAGQLLPELEKNIEGKEVGQQFEIELKPEQAYGIRDPRLVQLVPLSKFSQNNINPIPGLQINIDGLLATVRSVNGGRVIVDFNHPLAGKTLKFKINILKKIENVQDKIRALIPESEEINFSESKIEILVKKALPKNIEKNIENLKIKKLKEFIPELEQKEILFKAKTESKD